jgi:hypothetical protein
MHDQKRIDIEMRRNMEYSTEPELNADIIVKTYSAANLTYGSDKSIAISALARHIKHMLGAEATYLAGVWRPYLAYQLLWETPGIDTLSSRSKNF